MAKTIKAVGIAGSPRKSGSSAALLAAVLGGAEEAGARTETVYLNGLTYRGCQSCTPCSPGGVCRISDELTPVLEALRDADVWVLATPIYYNAASGQMKLFFDRCRHFTYDSGERSPQLPGRRAAAVIVTQESKFDDAYKAVASSLAGYLGWMGDFGEAEILIGTRLGLTPDALADRSELVEKAREIGRKLVERVKSPDEEA